jgi:hypothetical protein
MTEYTCRKCGETKPEAEMRLWAGKVSKICKACPLKVGGQANFKGKKRSGGSTVHTKGPVEQAPKPNGRLSIEPGFGFECYLEDGRVVLEQKDEAEEVAQIVLSRSEAGRFVDWVRELVEG